MRVPGGRTTTWPARIGTSSRTLPATPPAATATAPAAVALEHHERLLLLGVAVRRCADRAREQIRSQ